MAQSISILFIIFISQTKFNFWQIYANEEIKTTDQLWAADQCKHVQYSPLVQVVKVKIQLVQVVRLVKQLRFTICTIGTICGECDAFHENNMKCYYFYKW